MADTCKSCGAKIVWANIGGKAIPLNSTRVRVYVEHAGAFRELLLLDLMAGLGSKEPLLARVSHFTTCPNATQHSKRKAGPQEKREGSGDAS